MKDVISVIIPVYNVEAYLPQCLDSVLDQDHTALEVIVIDDGSRDNSGAICDEYAARDSRVKVIHQPNGGAAAAKNAGLRIATGEYLSFVDSDDYLDPNVYGYMLETLKSSGAGAVQFAFQDVYRNRTEAHPLAQAVLDNREYLMRFPKDWTCALLWNKLYKRSLYEGVFFEEGHKIDDEYFTYRGFLKPCKVVCDGRIIYNYRKRASSVMGSSEAAEQRLLDRIDCIEKRQDIVLRSYPELKRLYDETYLDALWYLSEDRDNTARTIEAFRARLKAYLKTGGNSFPPRYLWGRLMRLAVFKTEALLARCAQNIPENPKSEYYI